MTKEKWDMILSTTEPYNHIGLMKVRKGNVGTETIEASIIENGEPYDLTGLKIYFCAYFERFIPVEQEAVVVDAKNGKIFYTLNQYDMQGTLRFAYFKFMKANQLVGTTQNFSFRVISGIDDSCGDFGPYIQRMEDVLNAFEDVKEISMEEIRQIIESFNQQVIQQQKDFDQWFNQVREIIESIDPGGKLLTELIRIRSAYVPESFEVRIDHNLMQYPQLHVMAWTGGLGTVPLGLSPLGGSNANKVNHTVEFLNRNSMIVKLPENYKMEDYKIIKISGTVFRLIEGNRTIQINVVGGFY